MKITGFIVILCLSFTIVKGQSVYEERELQSFNRVKLKSIGNVYVKMGEKQSVRIEADDDLIPKVKTEVFGNELVISMQHPSPEWITDPKIDIYVVMVEAKGFELRGIGKISTKDTINVKDLEIRNAGVGSMFLLINGDDIITELSGLGKITIEGKANSNNIVISGAGKVDSKYLRLNTAKIISKGFGSCTVYAIKELDVKITGLGKVRYRGNPEIKKKITGIGTLEHL